MPSDLHYTPDEVRALIEAATPGPWRSGWDGATDDDSPLVASDDGGRVVAGMWYDGPRAACTEADAALLAAAPTLAADLLTFHDAHAALREQADRMRAVLLALADACDKAAGQSSVIGEWAVVSAAIPGGDNWYDNAAALRALAEVPR